MTIEGQDEPLHVLRDISLRVAENETVAIVGPSGAGKTTLLNVIGGLEPGYRGRVLLDGAPVWQQSEPAQAATRNRRFGFIFQESNLIGGLTSEENLLLPLILRPGEAAVAQSHRRVQDLLQTIGLGSRASTRIEKLSGGERQRVATARALIGRPDIILADEPTGNLDGSSARGIIDLLLRYRSEHGATLLVATHDNDLIREADRVLTLRDGQFDVAS